MEKIKGGYYLKARCIQEAEIATKSPCVREVWDWLLKECNHADTETIKRGQCLRSYRDIQEGLKWYVGYRKMTYSKWDCEKAMKVLLKATMIATTKTTRGILITVVKYDYYQDGSHYESHTKATMEPQWSHTLYNKNDKNVKKERKDLHTTSEKTAGSQPAEPVKPEELTPLQRVVLCYKMAKGVAKDDKAWDKLNFARAAGTAKRLIEFFGDPREAAICIETVGKEMESKGLSWTIETCAKWAAEHKIKREREKNHDIEPSE
jgi:hypothetical protein